jgi:glycosyltransferase involved in cell wall biosynthesis
LKNFALQEAKGELIAFNDSDDNWKEDKLEKQMKLLDGHPEIGFSITDVVTFRGEEILIQHTYHSPQVFECRNIFDWLRDSRFLVYNPTLVMRKNCFEKTGMFSESMVSGDYHFIMRLAYHFEAGILYEPLVWRRIHDTNMSKEVAFENYAEFIATFELLYRNRWVGKRHLRAAKSIAYFKMARLLEKKGEFPRARRQYLSSIRQRWFHLDSYMGLLKTFLRNPARTVNN